MKKVQGVIDSINFSDVSFEELFIGEDFKIQPIKGVGVFEPKIWRSYFGKMTPKNAVDAKIVHTIYGLTLPLKRYARNPHKQTLEFAGLHSYTEKSLFLSALLSSKHSSFERAYITRIDVAIDFMSKVPNAVIKLLLTTRIAFKCKNTTYYKSEKEKKTNAQMDIKVYDKSKKEGLNEEIKRLEFCFKGQYFNKMTMQDIDKVSVKMQKSIKKMSGLDVEIKQLKVTL